MLVFLCIANVSYGLRDFMDNSPLSARNPFRRERSEIRTAIDNEDGGLFENIIARMIGRIS